MQGWVSLHRKILDSETFKRLNLLQKTIAIYIILNASHTDRIWYDKYKDVEVKLKRGELVTSRNTIKNVWFHGDKLVTDQKIRTTFNKLERLGFLTIETTSNYTKLTVCNYSVYQSKEGRSNQVDNQEETKSQPSVNQEETTINNVKNDKNDKNEEKEISRKQETLYDESHYRLSELLYNNILKNNPNHKKPNLENWSNDIRKIIELDNRTPEQVEYLINWVQKDDFWCSNVLSPSKLRKQFDQLIIIVKKENEPKTNNNNVTDFEALRKGLSNGQGSSNRHTGSNTKKLY